MRGLGGVFAAKVRVAEMTFGMKTPTEGFMDSAPTYLTPEQYVCPDIRGNWGGRQGMAVDFSGTADPIIYRSFITAPTACTRNLYNATPQHVGWVSFGLAD